MPDAMLEKPYEYWPYEDLARLRSIRILWRNPATRQKLTAHWSDPRHPYREGYLAHRTLITEVLESREDDMELDRGLRLRETSLRCVVRQLPPVFGQFWNQDSHAQA